MMTEFFDTDDNMLSYFDNIFKEMAGEPALERVDLRDLLNAMCQTMRVTEAQKAEFFFALYDYDGGGTMEADELLRMILQAHSDQHEMTEKFLSVVHKFDKNGDHQIDCAEFREAIISNPELLTTFGALFNATGQGDAIKDATAEAQLVLQQSAAADAMAESSEDPESGMPAGQPLQASTSEKNSGSAHNEAGAESSDPNTGGDSVDAGTPE